MAIDEKYTVFAFTSYFEFGIKAFLKLFKTYLVVGPAVLTDSNIPLRRRYIDKPSNLIF